MASLTDVDTGVSLSVPKKGELVTVAISGTYNMVLKLQREVAKGSGSWETLKTWSTANATVSYSFQTQRYDESFRVWVATDTSGTAVVTLTDGIARLSLQNDDLGNPLVEIDQSRVILHKGLRVDGSIFRKQSAPATATGDATLTTAQMLAGILEATPSAAAAYTTPTGAELEAALVAANGSVVTDECFDLVVINLGGTGDDITMTAGASGISFVGEVVLRPGADAGTEQGGQGTWRFRRSAADTFIGYRVA